MTPEEFIEEILAMPDDDAPRLIYADWLEERGDPRAEFIRLQCELAALTKPVTKPAIYSPATSFRYQPYTSPRETVRDKRKLSRYKQVRQRRLSLLVAHCRDWVAPLGTGITGLIFERGFVEGGSTTATAFLQHASSWFRVTPLRHIKLKSLGGNLGSFLGSPYLLHVQTLELSYECEPFGNHEAALLASSPNLINLQHLRLVALNHVVGDLGCHAILHSPYLKNLKNLGGVLRAGNVSENVRAALEARFGQGV